MLKEELEKLKTSESLIVEFTASTEKEKEINTVHLKEALRKLKKGESFTVRF